MGDLIIDKTTYGNIIRRGVDNTVTVGKYCSIAANCVVDSGIGHRTDVISTWPFDVFWHKKPTAKNNANTGTTKGDITIGNDVWIGEDVVIMSGVKIGDGAVVGLRSVVTRDVPPYAIVAGVPAKVKKYRFSPEIIEKLLRVRWWDWPEEKIRQHSQLFVTNNFNELFRIAGI